MTTSTDVEEALDDVIDGKAEAALIDGLAWESYCSAKPGCARRLRVLLSSEAFPSAVIACQKGRFDADLVLVSKVKTSIQAFGGFPRRRLAQAMSAPGVASVRPLYREEIRSLWRSVRGRPRRPVRTFSRKARPKAVG